MSVARKPRALASVSAGIDKLPASSGAMLAGRPYAVTCFTPHLLLPYLAGLAAHSLVAAHRVILALGFAPEALLEALERQGIDTRAELARRRLILLTQTDHQARKLALHGADTFVDEIDRHCDPRNSLVVVAPSDNLFTSNDARELSDDAKTYCRWFGDRSATGVFLFTQGEAATAPGRLQPLDGWFAGLAHLRSDHHLRLDWQVRHWRAPEGSLIDRHYGLRFDPASGLLAFDGGEIASREQKLLAAPDREAVYVTSISVNRISGLPANWHTVQTTTEMLEVAARARAASFIIEADQMLSIEAMALLVHSLRRAGGMGVKIVVREHSKRLRHNHEMLMMRLGANVVIDASLSFSRFLATVESLRDQVFVQPVPEDFDAALLSAMPSSIGGYLRPDRFCHAVLEATQRGQALGVRSALIRMIINPQISHLEALRHIRLKRPGDLFSADDRSVYIFLFACREPDIDTVLSAVIDVPLPDLFEGQIRWLHDDVLRDAVDKLQRRLGQVAAADYSDLLEHQVVAAPRWAEAAQGGIEVPAGITATPAPLTATAEPAPAPPQPPGITRAPLGLRAAAP